MEVVDMLVLFLSMVSVGFIFMTMRRFIAKKREMAPAGGRLARWTEPLRSREWRRYGLVLAAGKIDGLALLAGNVVYFKPVLVGPRVDAADAVLAGHGIREPADTGWGIVAAVHVGGSRSSL